MSAQRELQVVRLDGTHYGQEAIIIRTINDILTDIQADIYAKQGVRTDAYYSEWQGALFVPEGYPLIQAYVILAIPDAFIRI